MGGNKTPPQQNNNSPMRRSQRVAQEKFAAGKIYRPSPGLLGYIGALYLPASLLFFFLSVFCFVFSSSRQKHLLLMTRHEAPEAKDRYLCPEYSSIEGIVSARAAAWFNKTLNSAPSRPSGPKHLKAEVPLGALGEQRMNTNNDNVTLIVLRVSAAGTL